MSMDTTSAAFFEAKYRQHSDPWAFASDQYEQNRYNQIEQALAQRHYKQAFEPGCSIGVLTQRLATYCDRVDAVDISPTAVDYAKARCAHLPHVNIRCGVLADIDPNKQTDLLVLSEIGYYYTALEWKKSVMHLLDACSAPMTILASHWLGTSADHTLSGDQVHTIIESIPTLVLEHRERHADFRLDRWVCL